jgi:p-cumic alcohol dehydrogenase
MSLKGKTALVTGAATGIGAAIAKGLAEAGTLVFGADIAWKPKQEKGAGIEHLHCDVRDLRIHFLEAVEPPSGTGTMLTIP